MVSLRKCRANKYCLHLRYPLSSAVTFTLYFILNKTTCDPLLKLTERKINSRQYVTLDNLKTMCVLS